MSSSPGAHLCRAVAAARLQVLAGSPSRLAQSWTGAWSMAATLQCGSSQQLHGETRRSCRAPHLHLAAIHALAVNVALAGVHVVLCRYRLLQPSSGYTSTYASLQAQFDLCVRCRAALCAQPSAAVDAVQQSVLAGVQLGGSSSRRYDMQELMGQVQFLAGQMKALQQVRGVSAAVPVTTAPLLPRHACVHVTVQMCGMLPQHPSNTQVAV